MAEEPVYPVNEIRWVLRACQADQPLPPGDPRRYDFDSLRGENVVTELADTLEQEPPQVGYHHQLLCGHRGAGKSTELLALKEWADANGFLTLWAEVDVHFGSADLQFSDLYFLAAHVVAKAMEDPEHAISLPLPPAKLRLVTQWFAEITEQNTESVRKELGIETTVEGGLNFSWTPVLGKLFARFASSVKAGSDQQRLVRQKLRQSPDVLIDLVNDLLITANRQLETCPQRHCPRGLLLLFDNLDRYEPTSIRQLLLQRSALIRRLACHAVFTMPVNLYYNPDDTYRDDYGAPVVLPMVPLRRQNATWAKTVAETEFNETAVSQMLEALSRRLDVSALFEDPADAALLVKMSGGCMRDLLHLVTLSRQKSRVSLSIPITQITSEGVHQGIDTYRRTLCEGLQDANFALLERIARRDPDAQALDDPMKELLRMRIALRYPGTTRWTDVHPLVIETEGFRRARGAASSINQA